MTTEAVSTELAVVSPSGVAAAIQGLKSGNVNVFHTFQGTDMNTKIKIVSATNNAEQVSENIGTLINLANVVVQEIELENEKTKKLEPNTRIVLVDEDGTAFSCVSIGVFRALENIFGIVGYPHEWNGPLPIVIEEKKSRNNAGKFMTIRILDDEEAAALAKVKTAKK